MKYRCPVCGYTYDEASGVSNAGILPDTRWEWFSEQWVCPQCRFPKSKFTSSRPIFNSAQNMSRKRLVNVAIEDVKHHKNMYEMSFGELSALCSALANSCEIQYLFREAQQFIILADYYKTHSQAPMDASVDKLLLLMEEDQSELYPHADAAAETANNRGAKRILRWSKNVTRLSDNLLSRYKSQGNTLLQNTGVYICEVCGYIHIGDTMPPICPVCRVSNIRIQKVE